MSLNKILLLGNPKLYETSEPVKRKDLDQVKSVITELHEILMEFRMLYRAGRAIAAPQIGFMKRLIYVNIDKPMVLINPVLFDLSEEMIDIWDDCMCFPNLLVKVKRHKSCKVRFYNMDWVEQTLEFSNGMSELIQHEYDHLNGILSTMIAVDKRSYKYSSKELVKSLV
jgi:peptide deformylase